MKNIYLFILALIISAGLSAQSPNSFKYQAVVRNASGSVISNQQVKVRISILSGSQTGSAVYAETFTSTTNAFGLITLSVGDGSAEVGTFATIDWSNGTYWVKVEIDENGGTNYSDMGTSQLLSVPYALYALKSGNAFSGSWNDLTDKPVLFSGNYSDLMNAPVLATVATSGSYTDLSDKPALFSGSWSDLSNKPTLFSGSYNDLTNKPALATVATSGNYSDLAGTPTLFSGSYNDLSDKPVLFSGSYNDLTNKPTFATVATTGSYADLTGKPTLFSGSYNDLSDKPTLFSGSYNDLTNKPVLAAIAISGSFSDLSNVPANLDVDATDDLTTSTIDDASTAATKLWSSAKTNSELGNKANSADVYTKTNLQTSGQATVNWGNLTGVPTNLDVDATDDLTTSTIDDASTSVSKIWSSSKTSTEINKKISAPASPQAGDVLIYDGSQWVARPHYVGELYGGGIIFYIDKTGQHGLIASLAGLTSPWGDKTIETSARSTYDGSANTATIIAAISSSSAAQLCASYTGGGFSDWYMPSLDEMSLMDNVKYIINKTLTEDGDALTTPLADDYWTSTEYSTDQGWFFSFVKGGSDIWGKDTPFGLRPVRAF